MQEPKRNKLTNECDLQHQRFLVNAPVGSATAQSSVLPAFPFETPYYSLPHLWSPALWNFAILLA